MPDPRRVRALADQASASYGVPAGSDIDFVNGYTAGYDQGFTEGRDDGANTERRRIILAAVSLIQAYRAAVATVLTGGEAEIADNVTGHAIEQLRTLGCICPDLDIGGFGEIPGSRTIKGRDHRCGMHEEESA